MKIRLKGWDGAGVADLEVDTRLDVTAVVWGHGDKGARCFVRDLDSDEDDVFSEAVVLVISKEAVLQFKESGACGA